MSARLGLVLGSGSARGWAHIGVIRELAEAGYVPDIVCGCSIGAFVGAVYANGDIDKLETWAHSLSWQEVLKLLDVSLTGGLLKGDKLIDFFVREFGDREFAELPMPFACVATDLQSGREIWLRDGSVAAAVRASIALPGLFRPVARDGRFLVDGGLVNPVPVSLARALDAEVVIAVDLGSSLVGKALRKNGRNGSDSQSINDGTARPAANQGDSNNDWKQQLASRLGLGGDKDGGPSLTSVLATSIHIMQTRIASSRLAGEPADVLLTPNLAHIGLMDYHRADEAITEGREAVKRMLPALHSVLPR